MDLKRHNRIAIAIVAVLWLLTSTGCAPQARYFNVDVRSKGDVEIPIEGRKAAVFSITTQNKADSIRCGNVAVGLAEKIEKDRGLAGGDVAVYSVPKIEFRGFPSKMNDEVAAVDTAYLSQLLLNSGAHVMFFVDNLRFGQYSIQHSVTTSEYDNLNVVVPYFVDFNVYDAISDKLLYKQEVKDSIYMQMVSSSVSDGNVGGVIAGYLPEISGKIGEKLGSYVSTQWDTQERMLISYEDDSKWETPYLLSQDFKWKEAVELWMNLTESENPKKAAFAAYNIAVGCEMMEQFQLARKWLEFSMKKYRFREAIMMYEYIKERTESL